MTHGQRLSLILWIALGRPLRRGMVTSNGRIIADTNPLRVYTDVGPARVSPADVRLDWSHPCNIGWLAALSSAAREESSQ